MAKPSMLVTGGSGYLGGWGVRLARAGWDVTATYLAHVVDEPGADWRQLDVRDEAAVMALAQQVQPAVIIHTASLNPGHDDDFEAVNAVGSRNVARAAASVGARLIHLSTDVVFDGQKGSYVEEDSPNPITPYGRSKALAEEQVQASGAEAAVVRTSLIYGWRPTVARAVQWMIDDLRAGKPVRLFTDEVRCPVWVESLAAAVVELADLSYTGVLHVAGAQPLSRYGFGVRLLRFHGVDPGPVLPTPSLRDTPRPLDCTLDCARARALLQTPLPGVDEVLDQERNSAR
ncbi:MAG: SDR family oxidoreductase [Anaerolineae bacterium]|nr:SDR family oxidoreductase [Anaerolineae bacterium]